ncbi:MAG: hypothetical protein K0Q87_3526 [Neobacillus sp.]|nr:hypothetical protein [Neobacillus sp.]
MKNKIMIFNLIFVLLGTYTNIQVSSASSKEINLVALGDSITHGTGDPSRQGYLERVRRKVEEKTGIPVQVSNHAIPKYTTDNLLKQLNDQKILHDLQKATYLVLYVGTNDFRKSAEHKFDPLKVQRLNSGRLAFSSNLHKILKIMKKENPTAPIFVLGLYHPYGEYRNQQEILLEINRWNTTIIDVINVYDRTSFVPTLDLFIDQPKKRYFSDSLHPNPSGFSLIANRLFSILETMVTE